jgi:uncharacterized protein YbjT (DUF2867 family)
MKIVIIGGTGLIGTKLRRLLQDQGHDPVTASPNTGVDAVTGEGLPEVLAGAQVVVDVANAPVWDDAAVLEFFRTSSRNLVTAEAAADVAHHVALSVVGNDRLPDSGYLRAKAAQEKTIEAGSVPYTILRATQFFEFIGRIADAAADGPRIPLSPALMRPVAADDVAAALADVATQAPVNGVVELAGPEPLRLDELARRVLQARGDDRTVIADPDARYYGTKLDDRSLVPGDDARIGSTHFADWLRRSTAPAGTR